MIKKITLTCFLFQLIFMYNYGQQRQPYTSKSKKAIQLYEEASNYYVRRQYGYAIDLLEKALKKDRDFAEAHFMLSKVYRSLHRDEQATSHLQAVVKSQMDNPSFVEAHYLLAEDYFARKKYEDARNLVNKINSFPKASKLIKSEAGHLLENINFTEKAIQHPVVYDPKMVPELANQMPLMYFPVLTVNQQELIFTGRKGVTPQYDEDIYSSSKNSDGTWSRPQLLSDYLSSPLNEGTCTISADGRTLIYTSCEARGGLGSCDLFIARKKGDQWSPGKNLGPKVNSSAWESQPSLSADGRTLYFVSDRKGGQGRRDIYIAHMNDSSEWQQAENAGNTINSDRDEVSPFIHVNDQTLYFSSNGRPGFGGYDLYVTEKKDQAWSTPKNLGYPINTHQDESGLFITASGKDAYYSQEISQNGDYIKSQIYTFIIPEEIRVTNRSSYVYGKVRDINTKKSLEATVELIDLNEQKKLSQVTSDPVDGDYMMVLTEGSEYALYINKVQYLFESLSFDYESKSDAVNQPVELDIYLKPIEKGKETVLNNIFFDTDKYEIKERSKPELEKIVGFMKNNQQIRIAINGHTDNTGDADYNKTLSTNRAQAVYNYLIQAGVSAERLKFAGYGQSKPIADNNTEKGRQQNRRITFEII